jgi:hypothetical protein
VEPRDGGRSSLSIHRRAPFLLPFSTLVAELRSYAQNAAPTVRFACAVSGDSVVTDSVATARAGRHLSRMSFLTDFTPATPRATWTAWSMSACDLTKPLNCTTPLNVSTLISLTFRVASL